MIRTENLTKTYAGRVPVPALKGVSLDIADGEFVAIMGKSGSGKSTLLHQLALIDTPTGGTITIAGEDVTSLTDEQKARFRLERLGYIFQEYALIAEFTAQENVWLPALTYGKRPEHCWHHAAELLTTVGLSARLQHYPNELSGGEQQRVAVARSLINYPKVLFADEPTANLDTSSSKAVLELFKKLNKEMGQTIVMVTHEPDDRRYVDRVIWLEDGLLERIEEV